MKLETICLQVMRSNKFDCDKKLNQNNVAKYEEAYKNREEILSSMDTKVTMDTLIMCGANNEQVVRAAEEMHSAIPIGLCSIIKVDDVKNVMVEAADKLADSFILFCQGLGLVPSVQRKISRSISINNDIASSTGSSNDDTDEIVKRKVSMEMFDIPNIRRLSLSSHNI